MRTRALLAICAAGLLAVGCASPQIETTTRLVAPADAAGRACVAGCTARKASCQNDCQTQRRTCTAALEPEIEAAIRRAQQDYAQALTHYAEALRRYERDLYFHWHVRPWRHAPLHPYDRRRAFDPGWYALPPFPPPPAPREPSREKIRAQLEAQRCTDDCGCLPAYDACFVACGGERIEETRCVKNCSAP